MTIYNGTITNFATAPQSEIDIGGAGYNVQTAGKSYSLEEVDNQTARFEIQGGDHAWFDGSGVDRSEALGRHALSGRYPRQHQLPVHDGAGPDQHGILDGGR